MQRGEGEGERGRDGWYAAEWKRRTYISLSKIKGRDARVGKTFLDPSCAEMVVKGGEGEICICRYASP